MNDKQRKKEIVRKVVSPYHFTDRVINFAYNNNLDSHKINHANSKITIKPNNLDIEKTLVNKIRKHKANLHARILIQHGLKIQTSTFSKNRQAG